MIWLLGRDDASLRAAALTSAAMAALRPAYWRNLDERVCWAQSGHIFNRAIFSI